MRIGTTPTYTFELPFDTDAVVVVELTFSQNNAIILQKSEADCEMGENVIACKLSQEDTFLFTDGVIVEYQLRVKDRNSDVFETDVLREDCLKSLSKKVL